MKSAQEMKQMTQNATAAPTDEKFIGFRIEELNEVLFHINSAAEALVMLAMNGDADVKAVVNMKVAGLRKMIEEIQKKAMDQ